MRREPDVQAFIASEHQGSWQLAREVPPPAAQLPGEPQDSPVNWLSPLFSAAAPGTGRALPHVPPALEMPAPATTRHRRKNRTHGRARSDDPSDTEGDH